MKWEPGQAATIKTKNFVLRPLTPADVTDRFVSWFADPKVMQYVDLVMNRNRDQLVEFTSGFDNKSRFIFGIFPKDLDQCIGFFHVYCNFRQSNARTAVVIGDRENWAKKVVPEARSGLLVFLFGTLSLHKVWGAVYTRNLSAVFNYKAMGFHCEGILRQEALSRDGSWLDIYRFSLLRSEWLERQKAGDQ